MFLKSDRVLIGIERKRMNPVVPFSLYDLLVTIAHGLTVESRSTFVGHCCDLNFCGPPPAQG